MLIYIRIFRSQEEGGKSAGFRSKKFGKKERSFHFPFSPPRGQLLFLISGHFRSIMGRKHCEIGIGIAGRRSLRINSTAMLPLLLDPIIVRGSGAFSSFPFFLDPTPIEQETVH